MVDAVTKNLDHAIAMLTVDIEVQETLSGNKDELAMRFLELRNIRARELQEAHLSNDEELRLKMEEAHLVIEQLVWLNSISEKIASAAKQLVLSK